jgi:hypothetical protein
MMHPQMNVKKKVSARNQTAAPTSQPVTLWTDSMFMVTSYK